MKTNTNNGLKTSFIQIVTTLIFLFTSAAGAAVIKDSGVDIITKHFVINDTSTVTHEPGGEITLHDINFIPPQSQTFSISGGFDVNFSRYWWSSTTQDENTGIVVQGPPIIIDGIPLVIVPPGSSYMTTTYEENWIGFNNVEIVGNLFSGEIGFPRLARINGIELSGDDKPCSMPISPDEYCSYSGDGMYDYLYGGLRGQIENGKINLQGWSPILNGVPYEGFTYNIQASAIPLPAAICLFLSSLGIWGFLRKKYK